MPSARALYIVHDANSASRGWAASMQYVGGASYMYICLVMDEEERCPLDAAVAADSSPDDVTRPPETERRGGCRHPCCSCLGRDVLARVRNSWMTQETIAICKLAGPMVSTCTRLCIQPQKLRAYTTYDSWYKYLYRRISVN